MPTYHSAAIIFDGLTITSLFIDPRNNVPFHIFITCFGIDTNNHNLEGTMMTIASIHRLFSIHFNFAFGLDESMPTFL